MSAFSWWWLCAVASGQVCLHWDTGFRVGVAWKHFRIVPQCRWELLQLSVWLCVVYMADLIQQNYWFNWLKKKKSDVMNSLCCFCALLDWKGIVCKYLRLVHSSYYCIFVWLKMFMFAIFVSARTLLFQWFHTSGNAARLNYMSEIPRKISGKAEVWSQIALDFCLPFFHLLPHANSYLAWDTAALRDVSFCLSLL